ncbi:kinase-like domain-containing protein [Geopyxis carbonaria]|nr:kinase-like domain-containing protein [Geopyxis carbonaria]
MSQLTASFYGQSLTESTNDDEYLPVPRSSVEDEDDDDSLFERSTPTRKSLVNKGRKSGVVGAINIPDHTFNILTTLLENYVRIRTTQYPPEVVEKIFNVVHEKLYQSGVIPHLGPRAIPETSDIRGHYLDAIGDILDKAVEEVAISGTGSRRMGSNPRLRMLESAKSDNAVATINRTPQRSTLGRTASEVFLSGSRNTRAHDDVDLGTGAYSSSFYEHEVLGTGAGGTVYKARHKVDQVWYALKKVKLSTTKDWKKQLNEVFTMANFEHPNIVRYFGCWVEGLRPDMSKKKAREKQSKLVDSAFSTITGSEEEDESDVWDKEDPTPTATQNNKAILKKSGWRKPGWGPEDWEPMNGVYIAPTQQYVLCITMALYPGVLSSHIGEKGSHCFHEEAALPLFLSIVDAIDHIHQAGFVHRDIKPANIFVQYSQNVTGCCGNPVAIPRIGDFGLVTDIAETDEHSQPVGTRLYMPPEGESGRHKTTDIWALGITCVELFIKFDTKSERVVVLSEIKKTGKLPKWASSQVSLNIKGLIEGCLHLDPEKRWTTAMIKETTETIK